MLPSFAHDLVALGLRTSEEVECTLSGVDPSDELGLLQNLKLTAHEQGCLAEGRRADTSLLARATAALAWRRWGRVESLDPSWISAALESSDPFAELQNQGVAAERLPRQGLSEDTCGGCGLNLEIERGLRREIPYCLACGKVRLREGTGQGEDTLAPEREAVEEPLDEDTESTELVEREATFDTPVAELGEETRDEPREEFLEDTLSPERPPVTKELPEKVLNLREALDEETFETPEVELGEETRDEPREEFLEDTLSVERPPVREELPEKVLNLRGALGEETFETPEVELGEETRDEPREEFLEDTLSPERPAVEVPEDTLSPERPAVEAPEDTLSPERPAVEVPEDTLSPERPAVEVPEDTLNPERPVEALAAEEEALEATRHPGESALWLEDSEISDTDEEGTLLSDPSEDFDQDCADERTFIAPPRAKASRASALEREVTWGFGGPDEESSSDERRALSPKPAAEDEREITWGFGTDDALPVQEDAEELDSERTFMGTPEPTKLQDEVTWGFGGESAAELSEDTLLPGGDSEAMDGVGGPPKSSTPLETTSAGGLSEDTFWPEPAAEPTPPTGEAPKATEPKRSAGFDGIPESTLWSEGEASSTELEEATAFASLDDLGGATFWAPKGESPSSTSALGEQSAEATAFSPGGATASSVEQLAVANASFLYWAEDKGLEPAKLQVARAAEFPVQQVLERGWIPADLIRIALGGGQRVPCDGCKVQYQLGHGVAGYASLVPCARCGGKLAGELGDATAIVKGASSPGPKRVEKIGPYRLIQELGRGGMGAVYEAESEDGEPVALKVLKAKLGKDSNHRRRFEREGRALSRFSHPNVVQLVGRGFDKETNQAYLAIELVRGLDLNDLIKQRRQLSAGESLYIMNAVAAALEAAHAQNLLHRDIKPGNVLLTPQGDVKVTDFGIALEQDVSMRLTAEGAVLGTPQYIAPEAIRESEWGPPVDVYALGCMTFKAIAGRLPFVYRTVLELLDAHQEEPAPRLDTLVEGLDPAVVELLDRTLAKDPAARPTTSEIQAALAPHLPSKSDLEGLWGDPRDATVVLPNELRQAKASGLGASGTSDVSGISETLTTGQVFHHYLLKDELGRGGMGVVYRARHMRLKKEVAVKVMLSGAMAGDAERRRFLREAESAAALQHPYVVGVLDSGEWNGALYLAMDHVDGQPLQHHYRAHPEREALLKLFVKVCEGVQHAHSRGVIHRDLKPDNVLVDTEGNPHVLDFGIAKRLDAPEDEVEATIANLTTDGDIMGTLRYMPPEQASGRANEVDVRSDVYTLGGILYELTTLGQAPFKGNVGQMIHQIVHKDPRPPSALAPDIPWELDAICLKALSKGSDQRYQSARDLALDVERYLSGVPIVAQRANALYRFRKWARRNRAKIAVGLAVAALLCSLIGAWATDRIQAERQRRAELFANAREGWEQAASGRFREASETFGVAQSRILAGEAVPVPSDLRALVPPALAAGHMDESVLERWKGYATQRLGVEDALQQVSAGRSALGKADFKAAKQALSAAEALALDEPEVRALRAEVAQGLFASGQDRLQAARAISELDAREAALEAAADVLEQSQSLGDARAADALRILERALVSLEQERGQVGARLVAKGHESQAQALVSEAEARLAELPELAEERRKEVGAKARSDLRAAGRELTLALGALPGLASAEEAKTRVHLRLAELALDEEEVPLAELAVEDARLYGRLSSEVAAVASRVAAVDKAGRAFRDQVAHGDSAFERGDYEAAQRAYALALAQRPDPDVDRRRRLSEARGRALRARAAKQLRKEQQALQTVRALDPRDADAVTRLDEIRQALFAEAFEVAQRNLSDAVQQGEGFDRAIGAYEQALALEPRDRAARRGRAQAYALRDRPPERVLVSVPLEQVVTGVARSDEVLRFYIDRTEVTREAFAEFVADGGYQKQAYWSAAGWAARDRFRDQTGRRAPAGWVDGLPPPGTEALPATGVSYFEAEAYARWRGLRLPSDREWRLAACFDPALGRFRPNPWAEGSKLTPSDRLRAVRSDPRDESPFGAFDMGLNASEWVRPDGEPSGADSRAWVRGLSIRAFPHDLRQGVDAWRKQPRARFRDASIGFRCVEDVAAPPAFAPGENR